MRSLKMSAGPPVSLIIQRIRAWHEEPQRWNSAVNSAVSLNVRGASVLPPTADITRLGRHVRYVPTADIDCGLSQATRVNERRVFGWVPVEASVLAACIPSSSSDRTAAERLMPPRLAHALIDTKREAGSRTVTSGSPPSAARALFVGFGAIMILEITSLEPDFRDYRLSNLRGNS